MAQKPAVQAQKRVMTRKRLLIVAGMTLAVVVFILFSPYGVMTRFGLSREASSLQGDVDEMRRVEDSLRASIRHLEHDSTEIERLARERYGYIREGEEVFIIKRDTTQ
jgi:cell division protein FtsB